MSNSNTDVINAFLNRKPLRSTNLSSDGQSLWSYGWWQIACHKSADNTTPPTIVVRKGPAFSHVAARQRSLLHHCLRSANDITSESPALNLITVINSELTPRSLGHMRLTEKELVNG